MLTDEELHERYYYHKPNERKQELHDLINKKMEDVARVVEHNLPEGREKSLVHTKLEEARSWANSAIARSKDL